VRIPAILSLLILASCNQGSTQLAGPGDPADLPEATLHNIWPSEDGSSWTYDLALGSSRAVTERPLFETAEEVPAQPSMEQIIAALPTESLMDSDALRGSYTIEFDGRAQTESGAWGKRIVAELENFGPPPAAPKRFEPGDFGMSDLLGRTLRSGGKTEEFERIPQILFVRGGVWTETEEYVGYLNDLDRDARVFMATADLMVGSTWSTQTIPSIAPYVWLNAQVLDRVDVETPTGQYKDIVRILYVFDTGVIQERSPYATPEAFSRGLIYATIDYAPSIGPVHFRECRTMVDKNASGEPVILPADFEYEARLTDYNVGDRRWRRR
jgi:hypothetical protein